jgi:protein phosphatase 2C family protein 2/3
LRQAHIESAGGETQKSGSCAVAVLIVGDIAFVANTGDSRAVMCVNGGKNFVQITDDHKPEDPDEKIRIETGGGRVYQNFSQIPDPSPSNPSG